MSAGSALARWFAGRAAPGQDVEDARVNDALATGAPAEVAPGPEAAPAGRRERSLGGGEMMLREVLAEKVLHGWMQNRHQVLFPLTVNLREMESGQVALVASMMAVAALAGGAVPGLAEANPAERARMFLRKAGGDAATLELFELALREPPALSRVVAASIAAGMAAHAYIAALVAIDARDPAGVQFLEYLVLRLGLPTAVVRSANRRYRQ